MTEFYIPAHVRGRVATPAQKAMAEALGKEPTAFGMPYEFFRGIHHIPDALADSHDANTLGIIPVEEMTDDQWRTLGLDKNTWMKANRPQPEKAEDGEMAAEAVDQTAETNKAPAAS